MVPTHPSKGTVPDASQDGVPPGKVMATTTDPVLGETDQEWQLSQPRDLALNQVMPDSMEGVVPQLPMAPPTLRPNTTAFALAPTEMDQMIMAPPGFQQPAAALLPSLAQIVPPGVNPDEGALQARVGDRSMADLAQSLAVTQAGGNPHTGSFTSIMEGLKEACRLMTEGFEQACLDMEVVEQKTIEDAMANDRAFTVKTAQDLNLWTAALQLVLDSDGMSGAEMETRRNHAWQRG